VITVLGSSSPGALRQELAARMRSLDSASIVRARFTVLLESPLGDLSALSAWLTGAVWNVERFKSSAPVRYFEDGERMVNAVEEVIAEAAPRVYDELAAPPARRVTEFFDADGPGAVVVFDGLSLREVPAVLELASASRLEVVEKSTSLAALPSETMEFVDQRLGIGRVAPSKLPERTELKERGIAAYYYGHPGDRHALDRNARGLLLWSGFPDNTYQDSGARFSQHFDQIRKTMESAWKATVAAIPKGRRILVTSDHGYIFFGAGLSFARDKDSLRPLTEYLGGERFGRISLKGPPPAHEDLAVYPGLDLAVVRGRVPLHPPGPASTKLYKHGGLSLMEMLTPWLVFQS
jgi:hypothetical protein